MDTDATFLTLWQQVPYLYCEAEGQAAMLDGKVQDDNIHVKRIINKNPPYVLKLSHHGFPQDLSDSMKNMNGYHAIVLSYRRRPVYHTLERRT